MAPSAKNRKSKTSNLFAGIAGKSGSAPPTVPEEQVLGAPNKTTASATNKPQGFDGREFQDIQEPTRPNKDKEGDKMIIDEPEQQPGPKIKVEPEEEEPFDWKVGSYEKGETIDLDPAVEALTTMTKGLDTADAPMPGDEPAASPAPAVVASASNPTVDREVALEQYFRKRAEENEWEVVQEKSKKRPKAREPEPEVEPTGTAPTIDYLAMMDRRQIKSPSPRWCAIQVTGLLGPVIGNPFTPTSGYTMKVTIEAGRRGLPQVCLSCRLNKPKTFSNKENEEGRVHTEKGTSQSVSDKAAGYHELFATWRPGVRPRGQYQMDDMRYDSMTTSQLGQHPHIKAIVDLCPVDHEGKKPLLHKVVAITFTATSSRISDIDEECWEGLPNPVRDAFDKIFVEKDPYEITIWLTVRNEEDEAWLNWGQYLNYHVNQHIPPFAQYLNADGQLNCHWDTTELINTFGKSMYAEYPSRNGVEDTSRPPKSYYQFPLRRNWQEPIELGVTMAMSVVRDVQQMRNMVSHINTNEFGIYCQRIPNVAGKKKMDNLFNCFVRMKAKTESRKVGKPPPVGSLIKLATNDSRPNMVPQPPNLFHHGVVIDNEIGCVMTGTDFCIWLTKNPRMSDLPTRESLKDLSDSQLTSAYIEVKVDTKAASRDLQGAIRLADPDFEPETLSTLREIIMGEPSTMQHKVLRLNTNQPEAWAEHVRRTEAACGGNEEQMQCVLSLANVEDRLIAVAGPPGTGKTASFAKTLVGGLTQDHKVLATAPLHISVDGAANKVWEELPAKYKSGPHEKFLMRLETKGAELRAFLATKNYKTLHRADQDIDERPELVEVPEEDAVQLAKAMAEAITDLVANEKELSKLWTAGKTYAEAFRTQSRLANRKVTNVPVKMTSGWHIHRVLTQAMDVAMAQFAVVEKSWTVIPACTKAQVELILTDPAEAPFVTSEVITALRSEPITKEEFDSRVDRGIILSIKKRSAYARYNELVDLYIEKNGDIPSELQEEFETQWRFVMISVYASLDGVFTTCNNAGSGLIDIGFKPDLIFCDETGQVGLPAFAVVVTFHTDWKAIYVFGDHQQLRPFSIAAKLSEFGENARLSILALLESKRFKIIRLKTQYRMAPAIMQWPNQYFYDKELTIPDSLRADNPVRAAGRKISQEFYGIKGPDGKGSEYWHINVTEGISQAKQNNTTLENRANSVAIVKLVEQFIAAGIKPHEIAILTYYLGQKYVHITKLKQSWKDNGRSWEVDSIEVSTVDAFQGKEIRASILDLVVAFVTSLVPTKGVADEDDDDDDLQTANDAARLSQYAKDAHRLCCALTRSKDILVVVSQIAALGATARKKMSKPAGVAINKMVLDAEDRGLIFHDVTSLDDSPAWLAKRQTWTEQERAQWKAMREHQRKTYLNLSLRIVRDIDVLPEDPEEIPVYNTRFGRTRRPIDIQPAAKAADATTKTRHEILNDPTAVFKFAEPPQPQRAAKNDKKAKKAETAGKKKAEDAAKEAAVKGKKKLLSAEETEAAKKGKK